MGFDIMNKCYLKAQYGATGVPILISSIEEIENHDIKRSCLLQPGVFNFTD